MLKKTLINNKKAYVKLKHILGQADIYFNCKSNSNNLRGHAVIISGTQAYSTISLPHYLRNNTGIEVFLTIEKNGIYFNFENEKFRF